MGDKVRRLRFTVIAPAPFDAHLNTPFPLEAASKGQFPIA
jgi:hypothetical protein